MKSLVSHLRTLAALLLAFAAFVSCVDSATDEPTTADGTFSMTVTATKGALSKSLAPGAESTLTATWVAGERVTVYNNTRKEPLEGYLEAKKDGATTTLQGTLNGTISAGNNLILKFLSPNYATQDGTLTGSATSIDKVCDYAEASVTVASVTAQEITTTETATFVNQQAIVKFSFFEKADGTTPVKVSTLTVEDGTNTYTVSPTTATDAVYVAIPAISSKTVTLTASDGISNYTYEKPGATFANGKYYDISVKLTNNTDYLSVPLTFEAKTAGATVTFTAKADAKLEYSINGGSWTDYSSKVTLENLGDKVSFRGNNTRLASNAADFNCSKFGFEGEVYAYGNMMSLLSKSGFAEATSAPDNAFPRLFSYNDDFNGGINSNLYSHPTKALKLPAINVGNACYAYLFRNCTSISTAPDLPALTLADYCYEGMFYGCSILSSAPSLPAKTLAQFCYSNMFSGCKALTSAPLLPAKQLETACYIQMFRGCSSLNNVICMATDISAPGALLSWLAEVAEMGTFIKPTGANWSFGVDGIPNGWTPVLPGKFSVSSTKQVYFSQGNLRASTSDNGTNWTWSFATNQYDCIGAAEANTSINGNGTVSANGTVDLFGWVGANSSLPAYGINNNSTDSNYGNVTSEALKSDWGHNAISNGGNTSDLWRTLSKDEWVWLVGPSSSATPGTNCRTSSTVDGTANARFTYAIINGTYKGIIVFPDAYTAGTPSGVTWGTINNCSNYTTTCTTAGWADLEAAGCVFMPAAGVRNGSSMFDPPSCSDPRGNYWSSTSYESNASNAYSMHFYKDTFNPENNFRRSDGYSVRLVRNAN